MTPACRGVYNSRNWSLVVLIGRLERDNRFPRTLATRLLKLALWLALQCHCVDEALLLYRVDFPFEGSFSFLEVLLLIGFANHHLLLQDNASRGLSEWELCKVLWIASVFPFYKVHLCVRPQSASNIWSPL